MSEIDRKIKTSILHNSRGVGIMEALVVTVIVALAAVAFLSLTENQNLFLRRTRQTNARDQLSSFLQGLVRDKSLLLFSARHPSNVKLKECLGDPEKKLEPKCDYGKQSPLYLVDLTDSTFQKVWTAPADTPALYDDQAQGCDPKLRPGQCRFQVSTYFEAFCPGNEKTCKRPERMVVTYNLSQIAADLNVNPINLRGSTGSFGHMFLHNEAPSITSAPTYIRMSEVTSVLSFDISVQNADPKQKINWLVCESANPIIFVQCLGSQSSNKMTATVRLRSFQSGQQTKIRLQIINDGPPPNSSKVVEIPVYVSPVCMTPWGSLLEDGFTVTAYKKLVVPASEECVGSARVCQNSILSGEGNFHVCSRAAPANCSAPWNEVIPHGQSRPAFASPTVPYGQACTQETRSCVDGTLSGTLQFNTCLVAQPLGCKAPWGADVAHGNSVIAYSSSTVQYGQDCSTVQQFRTCNNGTLLGGSNYSIATCTVLPPRNCVAPWGAQVSHNSSIEAYYIPQVPYGQNCRSPGAYETRRCNDSVLSGSFTYGNCTMRPTP